MGINPPVHPLDVDYANLRAKGVHPYCAMVQVAEDDKYEDYVICRGFDPRIRKFVDYEAGNAAKPGISVAKPFNKRIKCFYHLGQVFPAFIPTQGPSDYVPPSPSDVDWRVGRNPGTATVACVGQPKSMSGKITELLDHNNEYVNWMLIDSGQVFMWVELAENLTLCGSASAYILAADANGDACARCTYTTLTVTDACGVVSSCLYYDEFGYIPAEYRVLVMSVSAPQTAGMAGACLWVPICFGTYECCYGAESESSPSSSSSSSSASSGSASSKSESSKSTAIVPASWNKTGYAALFVAEMPEVRFDDVIIVEIPHKATRLSIDPRFVEVCEPGSIEVCGCTTNAPVAVGSCVRGSEVILEFAIEDISKTVRVVVRLTGTRRGFMGHRFPDRTRQQYEDNERFINSAYNQE